VLGYAEPACLVRWPTFAVPPERLAAWVRDNELDVVDFNEEHDGDLVRAVRSAGARAATWLDFYTDAIEAGLVPTLVTAVA
ncbi:MAG: hypothetical protein VW405_22285, partial [Rhodospirillaceae bacterium]